MRLPFSRRSSNQEVLNEKTPTLPYSNNDQKPITPFTQHAPVLLDHINLGFVERMCRRHRALGFTLLAILSTGVSLMLAFVLAQTLLLSDINYTIANNEAPPMISFASNMIGIDSTLRTFTVDWYPQPPNFNDCGREFVADIYLDQNLLDSSSPGMDAGSGQQSTPGNPGASTAPSPSVLFQYNSSQACSESIQDSTSTFRTISKLVDRPGSVKGRSTLQAYPIDQYLAQISMFALDNSTGDSIPMDITLTWGTVVNFKAKLDRSSSIAETDGIYLIFDVSRSGAVKLFVYCVIVANWVVTAAFLWLSIACLLWHNERIIKEMFVIPVTALFAFTTVRANLPGAPVGFGAYVDFVGILPNLVLITFSSAALLLTVLWRRVTAEIKDKEKRDEEIEKKFAAQNLAERGEGKGKVEGSDDEEAELMITVLMRKVVKRMALEELKRIKKKAGSDDEEEEDSDEEEAEVEQGEGDNLDDESERRDYLILKKRKRLSGSRQSADIQVTKRGGGKPIYGRGLSESSTYKAPI